MSEDGRSEQHVSKPETAQATENDPTGIAYHVLYKILLLIHMDNRNITSCVYVLKALVSEFVLEYAALVTATQHSTPGLCCASQC